MKLKFKVPKEKKGGAGSGHPQYNILLSER
jgi:hypothetical protein